MKTTIASSKKLIGTTVIVCLFVLLGNAQSTKYIEKYTPIVDSLFREFAIPKSIIFGIAIIESGMGKSRNCKLLKNHFGIIGRNSLRKTHGIKSRFKAFDRDEDSFIAFCRLLAGKKYYDKLKGNMNYKQWLNAIAKSGYATNATSWKKLMTNSIQTYKLYQLDYANVVND